MRSTEEMKDMKPHNPPNRCKKCKEFFRIPMHAPVNTKRCECKLQQISVKNIFETVITEMKRNGKNGREISEVCNTLHQQAMKEERERNKEIYKWLLGYMNFPIRRIGMGAWHWRKDLRKKLKENDIKID